MRRATNLVDLRLGSSSSNSGMLLIPWTVVLYIVVVNLEEMPVSALGPLEELVQFALMSCPKFSNGLSTLRSSYL